MARGRVFPSSISLLGFFVLVTLVVEPHGSYGLRTGSLRWTRPSAESPPASGICASLVTVHGYRCQELEVTTEDGFILGVERIPEGRAGNGGGGNTRPPVLLQHGVLVDGTTWLLNSPEQNLPLILADNGFDVWIANARGTKFSRRHVSLDPSDPKFWDWSWDELVTYDLPAVVDFVYNQTSQKINYVGHSQGTLIALASFSEGKLVDKLQSVALLSPIAYLSHMTTALGVIAAKSFVGEAIKLLGFAEFNPKGKAVALFLKSLCSHSGVDCYDLLSGFTGKNCCLNTSTIDLFVQNAPQSTSVKNLVHLGQIVRDGVVAKYKYGKADDNEAHYGVATPPLYNLSKISRDIPLFLSYGGADALSDVQDVQLLLDILKFHDANKLSVKFVENYGHADFVMAMNAKDIVYNAILKFLKR